MSDLFADLKKNLQGKLCVVGIGNRLKGDDGAGPALIDCLRGQARLCGLDTGVVPENYLEQIVRIKPDNVLLVDAMNFGDVAGALRLWPAEQVAGGGLSSHALSLQMVCDYLRQRAAIRILILGIQPAQCKLNTPLSAPVSAAVAKLAVALGALG